MRLLLLYEARGHWPVTNKPSGGSIPAWARSTIAGGTVAAAAFTYIEYYWLGGASALLVVSVIVLLMARSEFRKGDVSDDHRSP